MTPDQAVSAAFRAAVKELSKAPPKVEAYGTFLAATGHRLERADRMFTTIAVKREELDEQTMAHLEHTGLHEVMAAAIAALMALAHYPYLSRIDLKDYRS